MKPPVVFHSFPLPVTHITAVEPSRDRLRVASLHFRDCTADVLRRHGGDGGATVGARRWWRCYCDPCTVPRRPWPCRGDPTADWPQTRGGSAEVLKMSKVAAVPPRRSAVLTVFGGARAINDGTTAEPRRSWRCHCGLCRTSTAVAPRLRCDGGSTAESFRRATAKVRGFDSFRRCYGDQWRNDCGTTAIIAVPLRFMSYKHRSGPRIRCDGGH